MKCKLCDNNINKWATTYCSNKCQQKDRRDSKVVSGIASPRSIKAYLLEVRGHKCEICNYRLWNDKPIDLVYDHISGDSTDNSLENVRLICNNCDAQLSTFKNRNKGRGRHTRRQRYKDGLSY